MGVPYVNGGAGWSARLPRVDLPLVNRRAPWLIIAHFRLPAPCFAEFSVVITGKVKLPLPDTYHF